MPEFVRVMRVEELPLGEVRMAEADRTKVALCNYDGTIHALSNFCPHLTGNLGEGTLEEDLLVCPEHGWRFKVTTGRCVTIRGQSAHTFPVEIRDGWIFVGV
ncbi:3-phenylpropionate/cinnamic acid dioxygenase ferredoxin subunit [Planctomycetes bacterium Pan216]|uniref:3-phenylpropionate/cinnamic acid dioxygenase ferredoxin subunit n=1 Tax=Kolteria novifilia TaxID=2527975 RepID=A0A518AX64_9BACT|nr:3-phenylpropionate/cinnamic acid dioxygenase ferredoxin subunit [Planctomycetes bacterium Pan216]